MSEKRQPLQDRSRETREKILQAAMALFAEKGYDAVSTKDITREAGVAVGSFYGYFSDKAELFKELIDQFFRNLGNLNLGQFLKAQPGRTRESQMEDLIRTLIQATENLGCLFKDLHLHFYNDENIIKLVEAFALNISQELLKESDCATGTPAKAQVAYIVIENTLHHILYHTGGMDRDVLIKEVALCLALYLFPA